MSVRQPSSTCSATSGALRLTRTSHTMACWAQAAVLSGSCPPAFHAGAPLPSPAAACMLRRRVYSSQNCMGTCHSLIQMTSPCYACPCLGLLLCVHEMASYLRTNARFWQECGTRVPHLLLQEVLQQTQTESVRASLAKKTGKRSCATVHFLINSPQRPSMLTWLRACTPAIGPTWHMPTLQVHNVPADTTSRGSRSGLWTSAAPHPPPYMLRSTCARCRRSDE